jgi:SPOR domain
MKKTAFLALAIVPLFCFAQNDAAPMPTRDTIKSVVVHKDPRLDILMEKQTEVNERVEKQNKENRTTMPGFRIQVLNTSDRNQAVAAKTKMYQTFPELKAYMMYMTPYFKVRVGNFKSRQDAEVYRKKITKMFPGGIYIIPDIIEVKPEKNKGEKEEETQR